MIWNHRVVKRDYERSDGTVETIYTVREAYYDKVGAKADMITEDGTPPTSDTVEGLRKTLEWMLKAVNQAESGDAPVLNHEDF